jgi:hypothetical protein
MILLTSRSAKGPGSLPGLCVAGGYHHAALNDQQQNTDSTLDGLGSSSA